MSIILIYLINFKRKISILLLSIILMPLICFVYPVEVYAEQKMLDGYEEIASTQNLTLYCNMTIGIIAVKDLRNGYIWKSAVDNEVYDIDSVNDQWKSYLSSMIAINYINTKNDDVILLDANSASDVKHVKINRIDNGLSISFDFDEVGISITLEIKLDIDSLVVNVPVDKIREDKNNSLVSVELMPFFGAADRTVDGYILYPDGSGAITRYANANQRQQDAKAFTWNIYAPEKVDALEYSIMHTKQKYQAMLPVYGIKNGNNAILAASSEGEEDTNINLYPDGFGVKLNHICFEFNYRHFYSINLSNIIVNGSNTAKTPIGKRVDKNIIQRDHEIKIFFLNDENANYSGMANVYREYLIKNNLLKRVIGNNDKIPLAVNLFMGIKEERILFDKFIPMTTFENAKNISELFKKAGVESLQVMLKGWVKGGYGLYLTSWPPERRLGGSRGLKEYSEYAAKNGIQLYLQSNFTLVNVKGGGFSARKDVVLQGSNLPATTSSKQFFILNPFKALQKFVGIFNKIKDYKDVGVAIDNIGRVIYHDYNKAKPSGRAETADRWKEMMDVVVKNQNLVAVQGGNQYVLKYADRLYDIPVKSSDYHITDEAVPFYQMVVHGMIPYTSEPANLSYDLVSHKLKWVEYGCMPYFELTYQKSINLKDTDYNKLFTSYYGDWYDQAADIYNEFNIRLKTIWSQNMIEHELVGENLYRVRYSNGTAIYINYNEEDVLKDGYKIKAQDYLVIEREE